MATNTSTALNRREALLFSALALLFVLFVRVLFLEAPMYVDDAQYLTIAADYSPELVQTGYSQMLHRLGILVPLMVLDGLFGYGATTYYLFSISAYMLMIGGVFVVARAVNGLPAALIAVSLAGTSVLVLLTSSNVFPDFPNLAFLLFSFLLFTRALKAETNWVRAVATAALFGFIAYLIRVPNTIWLLCIPLYELITRRSIKRSLLYGGVFFALLAVESIYYWVLVGDPFARIVVAQSRASGWAVNMPALTTAEYVLGPWQSILAPSLGSAQFAWITGPVFLLGGLAGFILAARRRNWTLICLTIGGLVLFLLYGYTASSLDPLKRAIPLHNRYIVAFTVALAINAGYFLSHVIKGTLFSGSRPLWRRVGIAVVVVLVGLQVAELPLRLSRRSILNDRHYVADRMLGNPRLASQIKGAVYATPFRSFRFYPNAKKFDIRELNLREPDSVPAPDGSLVLFSRNQLAFARRFYTRRSDADRPWARGVIDRHDYYLANHPDWEYLLDTGDFVLARVGIPVLLDLTDPDISQAAWVTAGDPSDQIRIQAGEDSTVVFQLPANAQTPLQVHTFEGPPTTPPNGWEAVFEPVQATSALEADIVYTLNEDIEALTMVITEYSERWTLSTKSFPLPRRQGRHTVDKIFALHEDARSFRVALRVKTRNEAALLTLEQFNIRASRP